LRKRNTEEVNEHQEGIHMEYILCRELGFIAGCIAHIMHNTPHEEYVLEVAETNTDAIRLYKKLGFILCSPCR
jgi:ribosomal protein S18 acetylase RimI-like enzyme